MVRDVRDLLHDAVPGSVGEPDLDAIEARVARRRATRFATAALVVVGAAALGLGVLSDLRAPDAPVIDEPPTPTVVETAAPTPTPAAPTTEATPRTSATGGSFTLGTMPVMADEGVAVSSGAGVTFIGLDGTILGTLPGHELAYEPHTYATPGLVLVSRAGDGPTWIAPNQATSLSYGLGVPLGWNVVMVAGNEPGTWLLEDLEGRQQLVSDEAGWWLSADHRSITWVDPAGVLRMLDFDMGGSGTSDDRCFSSDEFADLNAIDVCEDAEGSWLEVFDAGVGEPRPIAAPEIDRVETTFVRAYFSGAGVVASVLRGEEIRTVGFTADGELVDVLGPELSDEPNVELLGVTRTGEPLVRVPSDSGGVFLLGDDGPRQLWEDGSQIAQVWTGSIDLAAIREGLGLEPVASAP